MILTGTETWNSTISVQNGMVMNSLSLSSGFLAILILIAAGTLIAILTTSFDRYARFFGWLHNIVRILRYTAIGLLVCGATFAIYALLDMLFRAGSDAGISLLTVGYAIGSFIFVTIVGYVASRVGARLRDHHKLLQAQRGIKPSEDVIDPTTSLLQPPGA